MDLNKDKLNKEQNQNQIDKESKIEDEDEEQKIIDKLKGKNNSDFYIYYLIKFIPFEKRKTYLTESEIQSLSYKNALKIEDRNKANYYFSLLKEKNKVISIFLNDKDYNIQTVKLSLFIFNFILSLTINALFFTDEAIYQINQEEGKYSLKTQIARILYSAIISTAINFIIELLAFSHKSIIQLRNYKNFEEAKNEVPHLIKKLKIKYILYFGMIIIFNLIFFYYITAFCAIYSIIQVHMISDSLISFLLSMSYSIIFSLISAIIRITSLKKENKLRHFFYFISWIISLI